MYLKEKMKPVIIKLGYNLLYGFSVCQIQMNKMINMLVPYVKICKKYLKDNNILDEVKIQTLNLIDKNGIINTKMKISDKAYDLDQLCKCVFDYENVSGAVLHDIDNEGKCINIIYMEKCPELKEGKLDYKLSKFSFIMVKIEHNNEKHTIELKNDKYNYYIVNNSLNKNFFKYYLKNILKVSTNDDNFDYTITIIDNNVNFIIQFSKTDKSTEPTKKILYQMQSQFKNIDIIEKYCDYAEYRDILKKITIMPFIYDKIHMNNTNSGIFYSCIANEIITIIPTECDYLKKILSPNSFEEANEIEEFVNHTSKIIQNYSIYLDNAKKSSKKLMSITDNGSIIRNIG